jgi:dTDP-4-amino-4,6-dideoxygalactose transaminase
MIPVFKPYLGSEEKDAASEMLDVGWLGMGKYVQEFENKVQDMLETDSRYVVTTSTGHAAIHLALLLAEVGPGDEVITPSFNNIADFQAILATGAEIVFCDVLDSTLCIDLDKAQELVTEKTKAVVVMDYDCFLCDHDAVEVFAKKNNVRIIHDAAHSFGSRYKGKPIGSFSDMTMFSFDPVKTITTLDGGILVVKSQEEVKKLHEMRLVGMGQPASVMYQNKRAWTYEVNRLGFRYHMSNMHAAIGLAQLSKLNEIAQSRRSLCEFYDRELEGIAEVRTPSGNYQDIVPFLYYVRVPKSARDSLREHLLKNDIDTGIHWQPGHWFRLFENCRAGDLSVTDKIGHEILSLPFHSCMKSEEYNKVANSIKSFFLS